MMIKQVAVAGISLLSALAAGCVYAQPDERQVSYVLSAPQGYGTWAGELAFPGDGDGSTRLRLPQSWGPEAGLEGQFSALEVSADGGPFIPLTAPDGEAVIDHAAGARLVVRYRFAQDYEGLPQWGTQRVPGLRPVTQPDYAIFVGAAAWPHPVWPDGVAASYSVTVQLGDRPVPISSSLGDGMQVRSQPIPPERFLDTLWLLGGFERETRLAGGVEIRTAARGELPVAPEAVQDLAVTMIAGTAELFGDTPFETYLMAAMPLPPLPEQSAVIGTALHQTFLILATPNAQAEEVRHTVRHEVLHEWITGRMGPTDEATDPSRMWFTEGFTEYFSLLVALREGALDLDGFLDAINALDTAYRDSPVRDLTRTDLIEHVWDSYESERLPYQRGAVLAFMADGELEAQGAGRLADSLARLIAQNQAHIAQTGQPLALTDDRIHLALESGLGEAAWTRLDQVTGQGGAIPDPQQPLFGCLDRAGDGGRWQVMAGQDPVMCRARIAGARRSE
jgi:predicted metalloprotease with PDZ domain